MASPAIQIDPSDAQEMRQWEQLFGDPMWQKFIAIQQARVEECKANAWVSFRDATGIARGLALIEVLSSIVDFQSELEAAAKAANE